MKFIYPEGATPFNQDDAMALLPKHITTQAQLNEWEQANILDAERWLFSRKHQNLLKSEFIKGLHKKMFSKTWKWAGEFRTYNTNIGVHSYLIAQSVKGLCDDVSYWAEHRVFPVNELCVRCHHLLVSIHPFPNGNGRHARLFADILSVSLGGKRFRWGRSDLVQPSQTRSHYIAALRQADAGDYEPLLKFSVL
jgi:Fic-DOC domain mobile mystery protein B